MAAQLFAMAVVELVHLLSKKCNTVGLFVLAILAGTASALGGRGRALRL
jgi:hypothetical protein